MKYFKKIIASGLAAMAAVSAMSMTALAAEDEVMFDISVCESVVEEINTRYGENIVYTPKEDVDSISQSELEAFKENWEQYAQKQANYKEQSKRAKSIAVMDNGGSHSINPLSINATYTLTHSITGEYIDITATGSYAVSSVRFGSCSNVSATCTAPWYIYYGYSQRTYTASVIDSGRTLAVTSIGSQWGEDTFGQYYNDNFRVYTEFYYTEL